MRNTARPILLVCITALMACTLFACSNGSANSSAQQSSEAAPEHEVTREDVEAVLKDAAEKTFSTVTFTVKTETTATGGTSNGVAQTQSMTTAMKGELDKSGEKPRMHASYEAQSNIQLGKTVYDMYIDSEHLIVSQGEQLYVDAITDDTLDSYASSVTSITAPEEIDTMLDMAGSYKMEEKDGKTTVSITVDKDKLMEAAAVDDSALPENNSIATMVVSYTIDEGGRFDTIRIMSSTSGTPTYRVHQSYQYSHYDETSLPEWPDLEAYAAERSGIKTDENGRMYIEGDDGQRYYVSEIGDDGMIYYDTGADTGSSGGETTYYYDVPESGGGNTSTSTNANTGTNAGTGGTTGSSDDQGRAYITADDGTIHFLDEEGSRLITNDDGSRYFIDADGNFYFLADE